MRSHHTTARTDAAGGPQAKTKRASSPSAISAIAALQQSAGNRATSDLLGAVHLQRHPDHGSEEDTWQDGTSNSVVQRDDQADPASLAGTVFEKFDPRLQEKLKDKEVFPWSKPTLAETLRDLDNGTIATIARIGAMISATAPFLWDHVKRLGAGGWVTDNFGMGIDWKDNGKLEAELLARDDFCQDNPMTAQHYHKTTAAYRQITGAPGAASMHVITAGRTEVHIDVHQPVEGKEKSWPWKGRCNYDLTAWISHALDVGGGGSGARGTTVGRYSAAYEDIGKARKDAFYSEDQDEPQLVEADRTLKTITTAVQKYAALGKMIGQEWQGDIEMQKDPKTMAALQHAEQLISGVSVAQMGRAPSGPYGP